MILLFPDADAVRLALTSGLVPPDVTLAPAAVSTDDQGRLYVEPAVALSKTTGKVLDRLGVKGSKRHGGEPTRPVGSWVELVPPEKEPGTPEIGSGTPVLFELPAADELPAVVTEMLRLGNDRQGFRWFADAGGAEAKRVLLRVVGPPYYTLLRALDPAAGGGVRAYLERAPRVWVEVGWAHPLAAQVKVADGQFALVNPPARWRFLADAPFRDVYELADFPLPAAAEAWEPADAPGPVTVPLRLAAGNAADAAELWVLRDDPVGQLDALVREADERLLQRLTFAVATGPGGGTVAVLRTRPSKLPPPVLPLDNAAAFKPFWKLPNLFLPVGTRLHPTLRRDAVRLLLADDPDRVVWLDPGPGGAFTPAAVPDAAFRSLEDWVDYVIEANQAPLAAWIGATRFDFDHFICTDAGGPKGKPDRPDREPKAKDGAPAPPAKPDAARPKPPGRAKAKSDAAGTVAPPPEAAPNEWKRRAKELEDRFLAVDGPLDAPERRALWPELAAAYTAARDAVPDAAVSWLNALWQADDPPAAWAAAWADAEYPRLHGRPVGPADLDARLKPPNPTLADARAVVAGLLAAAAADPPPDWLPGLLPAIQKFLDAQAGNLPVRATWLAATRLARLAGGDPLGLARARDRLLERLLTTGLQAERDLPGFLRFAGNRDADRMRVVRERVGDLHAAVRAWIVGQARSATGKPADGDRLLRNLPYTDLLFAFAFARLGEADTARGLLDSSRRTLDREPRQATDISQFDDLVSDITDRFLVNAFSYRVNEVLAGRPHAGGLAPALRQELEAIRAKSNRPEFQVKGQHQSNNPFWSAAYLIERMQKEYRVLEPTEIGESYTATARFSNQFDTDVAKLPHLPEPAKLANEVRRLYREGAAGRDPKDTQTRVVYKALALAHRVGESFALEVLGWVPPLLVPHPIRVGNPPTLKDVSTIRGELVDRAIVVAAHYGRTDLVKTIARRFADLLRGEPDESLFGLVNAAAGRSVRNLRRLGLRDEIDYLLTEVGEVIYKGGDLAGVRARYAKGTKPKWSDVLVTLANLAAGWSVLGLRDRAAPVLQMLRAELLRPGDSPFLPADYTAVACGYVRALGSTDPDPGLRGITELLAEMPAGRVTNAFTTAPFYSRLHLNVVEEIVWAVVSDEFALGPGGRKWLDDDEYLVRRRVHDDLRRERERAGV